MKTILLDGPKLKELAHKNVSSETIATSLSLRERKRQIINIDRMYSELHRLGEKVNRTDFFQFWNSLEEMGLGRVDHNNAEFTEFVFKYDPRAIGKACIEGTNLKATLVVPTPKRRPSYRRWVEDREDIKAPSRNSLGIGPLKLSIDLPSNVDETRLKYLVGALRKLSE